MVNLELKGADPFNSWKVYALSGAWLSDAGIDGDNMNKHKSTVGKNINFKSLKCKDVK